jgi:PKD repeat protein
MVQFNDGSSGSPTSWSWSFGDGGTSTERNAVHQYTKTGSYTVSLTVSNAYGSNKETKNKFVTVSRSGPAAGFTGTPTSGTPPLRVQFIDTSTGSPVSWLWSFGDGFCNLTTQQNPYHIYTSPGKYTVTLTVKDNKGGSDTEMKIDYVVTSEAPDADFTGTPTSGTAPLSVQFTDMSTGTPTAWAWDFENDGIIDSTLKNPSHTFSNAGTYAISLTATNTAGSNTETKAGYVTVTGPVALTYSMTNSETYRGSMSNLSPMGTGICSNVESVLNSVGWNQQFYHRDFNVTEEDFGTTGSGLVNSVLHYHFGHGNETKGIALVKPNSQGNYPVEPVDYLSSTQVYKKWGSQNKWVILDNCLVLSNASWGDTLSTSHGILGFASIKTPNDQLPATFFHFAMDEDQTVKDAWKNATMNVYSGTGIIAAYRFDTPYQRDHDHLPGHGEVAPDENPDDELSEFDQWMCY